MSCSRLIYCFFLTISLDAFAHADSLVLIKEIPIQGKILSLDETGNVYVVNDKNTLIRFTSNGDSTANFRAIQNGPIGSVDATNPLRILIYYPSYSKVVVLDRMLAPKNELDLRKIQLFQTPVVATSADGNLWVYDQFNARLKKVNDQLQELVTSNDLRIDLQQVPIPVYMLERDWKVYLADKEKGIMNFDRYGSYINTLAIYGVESFQVFHSQIVYKKGGSLFSWNLNQLSSRELKIPICAQPIIQAGLSRNILVVLYRDKLAFYRIDNNTD